MKILITGATGLVGTRLIEELFIQGHDDVRILTTSSYRGQFPVEVFTWSPSGNEIQDGALENVDIVINLAGENVAGGRWSEARKQRILKSRTQGLELLMKAIKSSTTTPKKLLSSSAIGIYGDAGAEELSEASNLATGFLADVCQKWEYLALEHQIEGMISNCLRTGIVLSKNGGALAKMLPPFKMGAGGILGNGKQYMSWVHIDDLVGQFVWLMNNTTESGIYNGVSPQPVTNSEFTKTLGKHLKRPTLFPVPAFMLKLLFGEMSEILIGSQKVVPKRFLTEGYQFKYPSLDKAFEHLFFYDQKGDDTLKKYQFIEKSKEDVFAFFVNEKNLEKITPPDMNFRVKKMSTEKIQQGSIIKYGMSVHGIPMSWHSKIQEYKEGEYFIDDQISGPYTKWVHRHEFISTQRGTLIRDFIVYRIPLGFLGKLFAGFFIRKDLNRVFNYRIQSLEKLLG
jgi:uncharacterized protein (TIGR01777 family)